MFDFQNLSFLSLVFDNQLVALRTEFIQSSLYNIIIFFRAPLQGEKMMVKLKYIEYCVQVWLALP